MNTGDEYVMPGGLAIIICDARAGFATKSFHLYIQINFTTLCIKKQTPETLDVV